MGMGNPKLRFIPNSWFHFHKFQKPKSETKSPAISEVPLTLSPLRKSYHFTRSLIDSPKKASRPRKPTTHKSNPSETDDRSHSKTGDCVSVHQLRPIKTERDNLTHTHTHTHTQKKKKKKTIDIGIDDQNVKQRSSGKCRERRANGSLSANAESSMAAAASSSSSSSSVCSFRQQSSRSVSVRRSSNGSPRIRVRIHSPRFPTRIQPQVNTRTSKVSLSKKGISSKSLAVVKCSSNPERDFRESMMEMIVENKIKSSKDLEDLLACYLSLNSHQYHHLIIQAFTHIWFDLNNIYHKTH